jgi:hypothetical protein
MECRPRVVKAMSPSEDTLFKFLDFENLLGRGQEIEGQRLRANVPG